MSPSPGIEKSPTGIIGLDELTLGGLPSGRPTLVCGAAGCGKTLFATTFLVNGARDHGEPGLFVTFEERPGDIASNVASLSYDVDGLVEQGLLAFEHIAIDPAELAEIGDYDLEGLFLRLEYAIDSIGAKRVVLDTIESLFSSFANPAILRAEIRRLFDWLKQKGLTTVITAERGNGDLTRQGLEEYVSDCVLLLDHRVHNQVSTRRLRIVKYRGTAHGTNEYPFLIDEQGFSVLPVSSLGLDHKVFEERVSTGVLELDAMLGGKGFHRGSSILITGVAGAGKSSLAASFVSATCEAGERVLYFSFEESFAQSARNMRSIGLDMELWAGRGLLQYHAVRPTFYSLEMHLAIMIREVDRFKPSLVVLDPISAFMDAADSLEIRAMLLRMTDYLKSCGITAVFTHLTHNQEASAETDMGMSSLMDGWILLLNREASGEFNRELHLLKARGTQHSNQVREFVISPEGIQILPPYLGAGGALTGAARKLDEAESRAAEQRKKLEAEKTARLIDFRRRTIRSRIEALEAELSFEEAELLEFRASENERERWSSTGRDTIERIRLSQGLNKT